MTDDEMIVEFIRRKGVTRCPPAVAAPTSIKPLEEVRAVHQGRGLGAAQNAGPVKAKRGWAAFWQSQAGKRRRKAHG